MIGTPIVVVEVGMTTPVGLCRAETAASVRSRTTRLTQIEWRDGRFERYTVGLVPGDFLPPLASELESSPLTYRESRMLRLADGALREAIAGLPSAAGPIPMVLGLAELETAWPLPAPNLIQRLATQTKAAIDVRKSRFIAQGRASALLALKHAAQQLQSGAVPFVLVGGLDSHVDLYILATLDLEQRLRNDVNPDGFAPGEGAGFLLVTTEKTAKSYGLDIKAYVTGIATGQEPGHLKSEQPYTGEVLSNTFKTLFAATGKHAPVSCVYSTFNGEHYWTKEFSVAAIRNKPQFAAGYQMEHPAECFGDLGAAHGSVMLGLAASGIREQLHRGAVLVYASSDLGARAAALLSLN